MFSEESHKLNSTITICDFDRMVNSRASSKPTKAKKSKYANVTFEERKVAKPNYSKIIEGDLSFYKIKNIHEDIERSGFKGEEDFDECLCRYAQDL